MLDVIKKLLILQERDRQLLKVQDELAHVGPERSQLQARLSNAQSENESARTKVKQIETEKKRLELDVEAKKQLIEKYSLQQFQTKKNEEYRALAHEIETCKEAIVKLEDEELELMEQSEAAQKTVSATSRSSAELKKGIESLLSDIEAREKNLLTELASLQSSRGELAEAVDEGVRDRYERLLKSKGQNVVVGINHGVCGGCHMQLSRSVVVLCQGEHEIVQCPNCGRVLYFSSEMDVAVAG